MGGNTVSGNKKTTQEAFARVQTGGDGGLDQGVGWWGREAGGFKTLFGERCDGTDRSAVRWRKGGRDKDDPEVSDMGN